MSGAVGLLPATVASSEAASSQVVRQVRSPSLIAAFSRKIRRLPESDRHQDALPARVIARRGL
jgi:hypothetical protein